MILSMELNIFFNVINNEDEDKINLINLLWNFNESSAASEIKLHLKVNATVFLSEVQSAKCCGVFSNRHDFNTYSHSVFYSKSGASL